MKIKGIHLIFFTALISGISIFVNSFGIKGFDSSVFTFAKNILVAIFITSMIIASTKFDEFKKLTKNQWTRLSLIGLVGGSIPFLLFFKGLQLTTGSTSAFIHKTMFVFVAIMAIVLLKEKLSKGILIGAIALLLGNFLVLKPDFLFDIGNLLILGATLFWAVEQIISKKTLGELSGNMVAFGRMFFGSIFIFLFLILTGKTSIILSMNLDQYLWIIVTSIFLLMYVLSYYNGLKTVKVTTAVSILLLASPITTLLSFIFLGSTISISQSIGMLLILFGVFSIILFEEYSKNINLSLLKKYGWN